MKRIFFVIVLLLFSALVLISCREQENSKEDKEYQQEELVEKEQIEEPKVEEKEITLSAIGDILLHKRVFDDAKTETGYDFTPFFEKIKPYLNDTTITMANQETMIGGTKIGLSDYPSFNSPQEIGDTLKQVGVDVVTIANNHTLDRGEKAIQSAIDHWKAIDMVYTGAYQSREDSKRIRVVETDEGIDVAFLSYTYGTNGIPVPEGKEYLVNLIEKEKIATDVKEAEKISDAIVLSYHFGTENQRMPNPEQVDLAQYAADLGVDVVIGHHPHVLQPVDWLRGEKGNKTFVIYSLANFISGQDEFYNRIGGVVKVTIKKTIKEEEETITVEQPKFLPTYMEYKPKFKDFKVIPMKDLNNDIMPGYQKYYEEIKAHMSQWMPELEFME
ncbi:CapA family protein [Radiobacillus deserti]|uniref:CapA family protein n=1 Tax=Radiobacillus deserti TaxID=2594883 RepID=A0A516KCK8_9BACI|nr:CapA family protein [Radiobacillus deserti]QDP39129.1 CapA family protein [Radiobacillus deserti]